MTTTVHRWADIQHESDAVYIGRGGRGMTGAWGNPFVKGQHFTNNGEGVDMFRRWLLFNKHRELIGREKASHRAYILRNVETLKGKKLGCFCKPRQCHGDILADIADRLEDYIDSLNAKQSVLRSYNDPYHDSLIEAMEQTILMLLDNYRLRQEIRDGAQSADAPQRRRA